MFLIYPLPAVYQPYTSVFLKLKTVVIGVVYSCSFKTATIGIFYNFPTYTSGFKTAAIGFFFFFFNFFYAQYKTFQMSRISCQNCKLFNTDSTTR